MVRAYKSAYRKQQSVSLGESLSVIGMVINLTASLVLLMAFGLVDLYKWFRS